MSMNHLLLLLRKYLLEKPIRPSDLYVVFLGANNNMLKVKVLFPFCRDTDTVKRVFAYSYAETREEVSIPKDQPELVFAVPEDAEVHLELFNVDNAENRSTLSVFDFVALDTIPPAQPGAMTVQVIDEVPEGGDPASDTEEDDSDEESEEFETETDLDKYKVMK
jgi:hypothetical protein